MGVKRVKNIDKAIYKYWNEALRALLHQRFKSLPKLCRYAMFLMQPMLHLFFVRRG